MVSELQECKPSQPKVLQCLLMQLAARHADACFHGGSEEISLERTPKPPQVLRVVTPHMAEKGNLTELAKGKRSTATYINMIDQKCNPPVNPAKSRGSLRITTGC